MELVLLSELSNDQRSNALKQLAVIMKLSFQDDLTLTLLDNEKQTYMLIDSQQQVIAACTIFREFAYQTESDPIELDIIYNLARRPGSSFKGSGAELLRRLKQKFGVVNLTADKQKLTDYYIGLGFRPSSRYVISDENWETCGPPHPLATSRSSSESCNSSRGGETPQNTLWRGQLPDDTN